MAKRKIRDGANISTTNDGDSSDAILSTAGKSSQDSVKGNTDSAGKSLANGSSKANTSQSGGGQLPRIPPPPPARHGLASWGAYHAARIAAHGASSAGGAASSGMGKIGSAIGNPGQSGHDLGSAVGRIAGRIAKGAADGKDAVNTAAHAISHPSETASKAADAVSNSVKGKVAEVRDAGAQVSKGFNEGYRSGRNPDRSEEEK